MLRAAILIVAALSATSAPAKELKTERKGPPSALSKPGWLDEEPVIVAPEEARRQVAACGIAESEIATRTDELARDGAGGADGRCLAR